MALFGKAKEVYAKGLNANMRIHTFRQSKLWLSLLSFCFLIVMWGGIVFHTNATTAKPLVYVIPVEQTIESGLESFMKRGFEEAEVMNADQIVLKVDTLGGSVSAALGIGDLIRESTIPTVAFVQGRAISAGSYISLNADQIVMAEGSSIGAAAVVDGSGNRINDSKTIAVWAGHMRAAAELNGRNPDYAEGMVDDTIVVKVPELNKTYGNGTLISFTYEEAVKAGYAEAQLNDLDRLLSYLELENAQVVEFQPTFAEKVARFLTNPVMMSLLLILGIGGVAIELFAPGFGVPGAIGVTAFGLYFFGHFVAGFAGIEHIVLFIVGIILLFLEIFVPSFGILGIAGLISLCSGIIFAAYDSKQALTSLGIAFGVTVVLLIILFNRLKKRGVWNRFILRDEFKSESGYTTSSSKDHLLNKTGIALSVLRPSGVALIDNERIDVVTSGEYIDSGKEIVVIHVEGSRVVVRAIS